MKIKAASTEPVQPESSPLEEVESYKYLDIIINIQGRTDEDVKARTGKATAAFLQIQSI